MQKGKLTPLALALGFAATVNGFAAEVTGPHIQTSRAFDDDTIYTVTDNGSVIGSDDTNLVEITIAAGKTRSEERRVGKECRSRWSPYH